MYKKVKISFNLIVVFTMLFTLVAFVPAAPSVFARVEQKPFAPNMGALVSADSAQVIRSAKTSHRLIVQLKSPSAAERASMNMAATFENGKVNPDAPMFQSYVGQIRSEQAAFISEMQTILPSAKVDSFINESRMLVPLTYQVVFNGMTIDPGSTPKEEAIKRLMALPDVKMVYPDAAHEPDMYASLPLINAPAAWNNAAIGGRSNGGAGVKLASMDGGLHKDAPMFDGTGFSYPPDFPAGGLGLTANNNGKIIASRAYFRSWDPPAPGDENPWPGVNGTPHGTHTGSTAGGREVVATYLGITETISGVAPAAWLMSYRVFYASVNNDGSFYNAEGIAALEDIVKDGADVLNNSWGDDPKSTGGPFDPLDVALVNASKAGVFVSMSNGNSGPGYGTGDHSSPEYINVAASTTDGTLASGLLTVTEPSPPAPDPELTNVVLATASFGAVIQPDQVFTYTFKTAASVGNAEGCDPFTPGTFTGTAAVISRGTCEFGTKVLNAENAGAIFVVIHNHAAGGEELINMGPGNDGDQVTIPSIFIPYSKGVAMTDWYTAHGNLSVFELNTHAYQAGNTPDIIASFSSRGPGVGMVLKPDITAPGVNILAQGFDPVATGEARHLGFGQASGTSMASPHVAGSAALLRQIHPNWTNAEIKSALMSTSKYLGIYNSDGSHAQPLDMGAGRLDLTNAADPGVLLSPPSLSFGLILTGTVKSLNTYVTNVASASETYTLTAVSISGDYGDPVTISPLPGFTIQPSTLNLAMGETAPITVTFDTAGGIIGDNQGFIVMDGSRHDAHMPVWGRVQPEPTADVLIIDNDASYTLSMPDYLAYYTSTLDHLGISYDVWDADMYFDNSTTIPDAAWLHPYKAIIYFTGDNYFANGSFTVSTPLTALDMNILTEYANAGGSVFAMGQDMAAVLAADQFFGIGQGNANTLYSAVLGGNWQQDSVTGSGGVVFNPPSLPVTPFADAPLDMQGISLDLSGWKTNTVTLTGANEVPPVATVNQGTASFGYDAANLDLYYDITIDNMSPSEVMTITSSSISTGSVGVNGPVAFTIYSGAPITVPVGGSQDFSGVVTLESSQEDVLLNSGFYVDVHTESSPGGEIRAQVDPYVNGDGAGNQGYIDEIQTYPFLVPEVTPPTVGPYFQYTPLLKYPGTLNVEDGVVAMAHREQPSLENPGIAYLGRSIYTTFGLEGVNNGLSSTSREDLVSIFMNWAMDEPTGVVTNTTTLNASHESMFEAGFASNIAGVTPVSYRWDFGDGSEYTIAFQVPTAGHVYEYCGFYTVRVEITDSFGNHVVTNQVERIDHCTSGWRYILPLIQNQ